MTKPVKYSIKSGEDFYSILKYFELDPVMGQGGSFERLQIMNKFTNQNTVQAGTEIMMPFKCEEQVMRWRVIDRGEYRLITTERLDKTDPNAAKIKSENISPDQKTSNILNNDMPGGVDLDAVDTDQSTDISEALRYRMICDGEWTGTECITRYSALYLAGGAWYNRYDGVDVVTGGSGTLLSKLNPEFGFGWNNYWSKNFRTDINFSIIHNDLHPEVRERPIEQAKKVLNALNVEARYEVGRWGVKVGLTQRERLFYRFLLQNLLLLDDGGVVVNAVPVLDLHVGGSYMIRQVGKFRFDIEASYSSLQGTSTSGYNVLPGSAYEIAASVQHDRKEEYIFGTLKYEVSQQDTDILLQEAKELGFKFGYAWKLKDW